MSTNPITATHAHEDKADDTVSLESGFRRQLIAGLLIMCGPSTYVQANLVVVDTNAVYTQLQHSRAKKDNLLRFDQASPLPSSEQTSFSGLNYYPPQIDFHIKGDLHLYGRQRRVLSPTNTDSLVHVVRFGRFVAEFRGDPFWLEIYRTEGTDQLSVFFTDPTNGVTTYGGGRYAPIHRLPDGQYLLDFNEAYNPYCAYNEIYICPLPPTQNRLTFPVKAGETAHTP